jgi:hypothetical protein
MSPFAQLQYKEFLCIADEVKEHAGNAKKGRRSALQLSKYYIIARTMGVTRILWALMIQLTVTIPVFIPSWARFGYQSGADHW